MFSAPRPTSVQPRDFGPWDGDFDSFDDDEDAVVLITFGRRPGSRGAAVFPGCRRKCPAFLPARER